jgi:hypothetical protein
MLRAFYHRIRTIRNSGLLSFVLVRMIRLYVNIIKLPNPSTKTTILKIVILIDSESVSRVQTIKNFDFRQSVKALHECCLRITITIAMVVKTVCMSRR